MLKVDVFFSCCFIYFAILLVLSLQTVKSKSKNKTCVLSIYVLLLSSCFSQLFHHRY